MPQPQTAIDTACDVFHPDCPARSVLDILADKWTLLVLQALAKGTARPSDLRRAVGGISEKMLIQTLRKLERWGLVSRFAYPQVPPRVEYRLSTVGISLSAPIKALNTWVETHAMELALAHQAFDNMPQQR